MSWQAFILVLGFIFAILETVGISVHPRFKLGWAAISCLIAYFLFSARVLPLN